MRHQPAVLQRDEVGDGTPPRTRIDLDKGIADVVLPGEGGTPGPRPTAEDRSDAEENPSR
ncbi:DUF6191 domain-containing protein [Streptomyces yerevanensis]|uniref:DUF6191 domain-containing protein n=1 Tax=Streptomyces yerevanensis TaxID=66378 RepID=UPI000524B10A|nr:DUF6191 domain-containing protein [Streptomyces yerevanensis]